MTGTFSNDVTKHTLVIGGFPIEGYISEEKAMWTPDGDSASATIGADNFTTTNRLPFLATISFTLSAGSPSVTVLSTLFPNDAGSQPFMMKNGSNGSTITGVATMKKSPDFGLKTTDDGYTYDFIASDNIINRKGV
jgi:hypothetical protein